MDSTGLCASELDEQLPVCCINNCHNKCRGVSRSVVASVALRSGEVAAWDGRDGAGVDFSRSLQDQLC